MLLNLLPFFLKHGFSELVALMEHLILNCSLLLRMLGNGFLEFSEPEHLISVLSDPHFNSVDINTLLIKFLPLLYLLAESLLIDA